MYAASFFKHVVNIPRSLCLVVGGVMSGALYLGGVMTVNQINRGMQILDRVDQYIKGSNSESFW